MAETCSYCNREATYRVEGWIEVVGESEGPAYTLVCVDHIKDFESDDYEMHRRHGFETVSAIIHLVAENG